MSELRNELIMDPHGLGYAPLLAAGSANQVAALLNEPRYEALASASAEYVATTELQEA